MEHEVAEATEGLVAEGRGSSDGGGDAEDSAHGSVGSIDRRALWARIREHGAQAVEAVGIGRAVLRAESDGASDFGTLLAAEDGQRDVVTMATGSIRAVPACRALRLVIAPEHPFDGASILRRVAGGG